MLEKWLVEDGSSGESHPSRAGEVGEVGKGCDGMSEQARLQSLAGIACIRVGESGEVTLWDGAAERLFGYDAEQMVGRDLFCLVPSAEEGETLRGFFKACLRGAAVSEVSTTCMARDGESLFCRWYATPAAGDAGCRGLALLVKDVTEQMLAVGDLNRVRQQARSVFKSSPIGIFQADTRQRLIVANPELSWMLGYESPRLLISTLEDVVSIFADSDQADHFLFQLYEGEQLSRFRCRLRRRDGSFIWASCYGQVTRNDLGRVNGFYGFCIDISLTVRVEEELIRVNEELRLVSIMDGLTRIPNRRHFDERMQVEWNRHVREEKTLSVILCDIDHFKLFNDTHGHPAGDECLVRVAEALATCVSRPGDLVARYGGEEFVVILPQTDLSGARHLAEVMRRKVEALAIFHGHSGVASHVTISLGVASQQARRDSSFEVLIRMADRALYDAKDRGRNRWVASGENS